MARNITVAAERAISPACVKIPINSKTEEMFKPPRTAEDAQDTTHQGPAAETGRDTARKAGLPAGTEKITATKKKTTPEAI